MPKILVVGGGLAGIAASLALRRAGHTVQVFEASELSTEDTEGAVVQIGPKVNDVLEKWGVDSSLALPVRIKETLEFDAEGMRRSMQNEPKPAGWKWYKRSNLHRGLLASAVASTGPGHPVEIFLGKSVDSVNPESASVSIRGGQIYYGDAVVGADGWHSTARKILTDRETSIPGPKRATIHFRVDVAGFHGNPVVQRLRLEPQRCEKWTDGDKELKMYFVEPGTIIVDGILPISKESVISGQALKGGLLDAFGSDKSPLKDILEGINPSALKFWFLPILPHIEKWSYKRLVLIGDAAHPFLPFELPGTSQSLTGADALATTLKLDSQVEEIPDRLAAWVVTRKERVKTIQALERKDWPPL